MRQPLLCRHDPLKHQLAGEIHIHIVFKDDRDLRERKFGKGADLRQPRQAGQLKLKRIGDKPLHFDRREARRFGQYLYLDVRHVGVGVDRNGLKGEEAGGGQEARQPDDQDALPQRKFQ